MGWEPSELMLSSTLPVTSTPSISSRRVVLLEQVHQIGGGVGGKPVVAECRFVHIHITVFAQFFKILNSDRIYSIAQILLFYCL